MGAKMLNYDERVRITDAYERNHDAALVADVFGVSEREVYRLEQRKKDGDLALRVHDRGRKSKLSAEDHERIRDLLTSRPDITIKEIKSTLNLDISISRLSRIIRNSGYRLKKKVMHASEQKRPRRAEET